MTHSPSAQGFCDPAFAAVGDAFTRNFAERGELGAAVAVAIDGVPVVDLWGGLADAERATPWERDTMAVVFSTTKGLAAICLHILADRGLLEFEAPVARYWPEFAAAGKADITVAMLLSHQAGLPVWREPLAPGALHDHAAAATLLAEQAPLWEPGTAHGYHGITIGWLEDELVRRITGLSLSAFFKAEVAGPLGADAWIGLPAEHHHRVATTYLAEPDLGSDFFRKMADEPDWYGTKLVTNDGGDIAPASVNSSERRSMEHASAGGVTNARALARIYAPLARDGSLDGLRIVDARMLPGMRTVRSASNCDLILRLPTTFTLGFSKTWGARARGPGEYVILGESAFGTPGMGGSIGFADSEARMSFGYVMNRLGGGVGLNERGQSMIDAAYRALR